MHLIEFPRVLTDSYWVIGGYLTEINVTSPTGLQEINRFDGVSLDVDLWDAMESRFAETRA